MTGRVSGAAASKPASLRAKGEASARKPAKRRPISCSSGSLVALDANFWSNTLEFATKATPAHQDSRRPPNSLPQVCKPAASRVSTGKRKSVAVAFSSRLGRLMGPVSSFSRSPSVGAATRENKRRNSPRPKALPSHSLRGSICSTASGDALAHRRSQSLTAPVCQAGPTQSLNSNTNCRAEPVDNWAGECDFLDWASSPKRSVGTGPSVSKRYIRTRRNAPLFSSRRRNSSMTCRHTAMVAPPSTTRFNSNQGSRAGIHTGSQKLCLARRCPAMPSAVASSSKRLRVREGSLRRNGLSERDRARALGRDGTAGARKPKAGLCPLLLPACG